MDTLLEPLLPGVAEIQEGFDLPLSVAEQDTAAWLHAEGITTEESVWLLGHAQPGSSEGRSLDPRHLGALREAYVTARLAGMPAESPRGYGTVAEDRLEYLEIRGRHPDVSHNQVLEYAELFGSMQSAGVAMDKGVTVNHYNRVKALDPVASPGVSFMGMLRTFGPDDASRLLQGADSAKLVSVYSQTTDRAENRAADLAAAYTELAEAGSGTLEDYTTARRTPLNSHAGEPAWFSHEQAVVLAREQVDSVTVANYMSPLHAHSFQDAVDIENQSREFYRKSGIPSERNHTLDMAARSGRRLL